jgi:hypothetical protein
MSLLDSRLSNGSLINKDRAGAAMPGAAAVLCPCQPPLLPEIAEQGHFPALRVLNVFSVQNETDHIPLHGIENLTATLSICSFSIFNFNTKEI